MTVGEVLSFLPAIVVGSGAAFGYGRLTTRVEHVERRLDDGLNVKASKELVSAQYDAIIARLDRIEHSIDESRRQA